MKAPRNECYCAHACLVLYHKLMTKSIITLVLSDIRSVHNVGSIFRTADAAGVSKIYLCGHSPTPLDRFGRVRGDLAKVALGAEKTIPWEYCKTAAQAMKKLRAEKFQIIALEQSSSSKDYKKVKPQKRFALVVGNEVRGMPDKLLKNCDQIVEISMKGKKESLNVGVALGIALFRLAGI